MRADADGFDASLDSRWRRGRAPQNRPGEGSTSPEASSSRTSLCWRQRRRSSTRRRKRRPTLERRRPRRLVNTPAPAVGANTSGSRAVRSIASPRDDSIEARRVAAVEHERRARAVVLRRAVGSRRTRRTPTHSRTRLRHAPPPDPAERAPAQTGCLVPSRSGDAPGGLILGRQSRKLHISRSRSCRSRLMSTSRRE